MARIADPVLLVFQQAATTPERLVVAALQRTRPVLHRASVCSCAEMVAQRYRLERRALPTRTWPRRTGEISGEERD